MEKSTFVGGQIDQVLDSTTMAGSTGAADILERIQRILRGQSDMEVLEHSLEQRWFRTRIIFSGSAESGHPIIRGVVGVSIDVTDLKVRATLEIEKTQLLANEHAANEANQLKSQFLANMSHELRTPIAEVLGMVDLLIETPLVAEQLEYARSVPQSADSLLSMVNDVLDFSKIEAGRFEIEEITFDLSGLLGGLVSLMRHAASRKALELSYETDVQAIELVQGDPGRVPRYYSTYAPMPSNSPASAASPCLSSRSRSREVQSTASLSKTPALALTKERL